MFVSISMFFSRWLLSSTHNSSSAPTEALCLRLRWRWGEGCHSAVSSCSCGRRAAPADPRSYSASPHLPASRPLQHQTIIKQYLICMKQHYLSIWPRPCYCCSRRLLTFIRANPGICRSLSALPCIAGHCRHLHLYSETTVQCIEEKIIFTAQTESLSVLWLHYDTYSVPPGCKPGVLRHRTIRSIISTLTLHRNKRWIWAGK